MGEDIKGIVLKDGETVVGKVVGLENMDKVTLPFKSQRVVNKGLKPIHEIFYEHELVLRACKDICPKVKELADMISYRIGLGNKVIILGNGGSAADAQHFAGELIGKFFIANRPPIEAIALNCNSTIITALANDFSGNDIFARQVIAHTRAEDVVIGLSTSGTSINIVAGLACAKKCGGTTVMISGDNADRAGADLNIDIPSRSTPRIQEMTILILHIISELVEKELYK